MRRIVNHQNRQCVQNTPILFPYHCPGYGQGLQEVVISSSNQHAPWIKVLRRSCPTEALRGRFLGGLFISLSPVIFARTPELFILWESSFDFGSRTSLPRSPPPHFGSRYHLQAASQLEAPTWTLALGPFCVGPDASTAKVGAQPSNYLRRVRNSAGLKNDYKKSYEIRIWICFYRPPPVLRVRGQHINEGVRGTKRKRGQYEGGGEVAWLSQAKTGGHIRGEMGGGQGECRLHVSDQQPSS